MANELQDQKIAFVVSNEGIEQAELTDSWQAVVDAGAEAHLIAPKPGEAQAFNHLDKADVFPVDRTTREVSVEEYDGLVLPGGVANADLLRMDEPAVALTRAFFDAGKPAGVICHAPWMLVEADVVRGRTITSWPSLKTDIRNAGGTWVNEEVHIDGRLVTSRKPADLPAFCRSVLEIFGARVTAS
jgi:protease I